MAKKLTIGLVVLIAVFIASTFIAQNKINNALTEAGVTHWDFRLKTLSQDHIALKSLQVNLSLDDYLISLQLKDLVIDLNFDLENHPYGMDRVTIEYLQASISELSVGNSLKVQYDIRDSLNSFRDITLPTIEVGQSQLSYFQNEKLFISASGAFSTTPERLQMQQKLEGSTLPTSELVASLSRSDELSLKLDHVNNLFSIALESKLGNGNLNPTNLDLAIQGHATLDKNNDLWDWILVAVNSSPDNTDLTERIQNSLHKYQSYMEFKDTLTLPNRYDGPKAALIHELKLKGNLTYELDIALESESNKPGSSDQATIPASTTEYISTKGKLKFPHAFSNGQLILEPETLETLLVTHHIDHSYLTDTPILEDIIRYTSTEPVPVQHRLTIPSGLILTYNLDADLSFKSGQELVLTSNTVDIPLFTQLSISQTEGILFPQQTFSGKLDLMLDISQTYTKWQGDLSLESDEELIEAQLLMKHGDQDQIEGNFHYFIKNDELKGNLNSKITFSNSNATFLAKRMLARKTIKELEGFTLELTGDIEANQLSTDDPSFKLTGPIQTSLDRLADEYLILHDLSFKAELAAEAKVATFSNYQNNIRVLNIGIPVTNFQSKGSFSYHLDDDKLNYNFDELRLELFSGYLGLASPTNGDFWLTPPTAPDNSSPANWQMVMSNIDLGDIAATLEATDIEMSGEIRGHFPLLLSSSGIVQVNNGTIESIPPGGFMKYTDQATLTSLYETDPQMRLVSETLENFQYTKLAGSLDVEEDGRMPMLIQLNGRNPDKNKGLAVNLNINLDYNLYDHLKSLRLTSEGFAQELEDNISERR